ncbi:geranylgeranyl reductase family protein [Chlorobaculum thiosulfatiphilum]|jgi:geranylgeranyl reductase family protein|uniref:Geranylgeranyl reductase family protein n=1 Tax=Chlorobaculum thiosulfatiphilum TaxID=115852 RepID=A0A5C4S0W5_CHLTI|nr:geranylgeranyl reductase family protein [Chlorobaculum thiosulfatiphilum]TNJ37153.1 geranylgeranyl reductase family protein [Chlorobaculum thiosulfatiphilum]
MTSYDAVISGAGPAGCSAALFLARKGYSVLLLEKERFPRDKVCGDGITSRSTALLEEMGVMEVIRQRVGQLTVFKGVTLYSPTAAVVHGKFSQAGCPEGAAYVIPRRILDDGLAATVKAHPSITFFENTTVNDLITEGGRASGVSTSKGEYFGRVVLAADGFYSPIASRLNLKNSLKTHQGFAIRAYFSQVEGLTDSIELHYDRSMLPGYGWIFPAGDGRANIGVGVITRFKDQRGLKRLFERFVSGSTPASEKLKRAVMEPGTLRAWPLPMGSLPGKRGRGNVLLTGDAGSFVDPLTGEGIFYALKSGQLAAEAAARALDAAGETRAIVWYEKFWRKEFLFHDFTVGYALQALLNNEYILESLMQFAARKQTRADLLADVIGHNRKKIELLKLIVPFF